VLKVTKFAVYHFKILSVTLLLKNHKNKFLYLNIYIVQTRYYLSFVHFMEPSDYDEISLCKILYFVRGIGLLVE
jgi:hypothetical protein